MIMRLGFLISSLVLAVAPGAARADDVPFEVVVDASRAPEGARHGERIKALCESWYPKINEFLFGTEHKLPYRQVKIVIEPGEGKPVNLRGLRGTQAAYTRGGVIHLPMQSLRQSDDEIDALTVHELTHVVQDNYALQLNCNGMRAVNCFIRSRLGDRDHGMGWASEAINDYVAFRLFQKTLEPRLRLDGEGRLRGYDGGVPLLRGLEQADMRIGDRSYEIGYAVAASFLLWLEETRDREVVRKLNLAFSEHRCTRELFRKLCGDTVERRWREFLAASKAMQ